MPGGPRSPLIAATAVLRLPFCVVWVVVAPVAAAAVAFVFVVEVVVAVARLDCGD